MQTTRLAAVLMPLIEIDDQWHLLFTRRAATLVNHRGQVSFPGGAWEESDENLESTALREVWEEIGIPSENIELLGCLEPRMLISGFLVTPVIGKISWPTELKITELEVEKVFSIPFSWLINNDNRYLQDREWLGNKYPVVYYNPYDEEVLWGATASMTLELLKILGLII
ncbi:MAG: CoA pyrophosphatase [Anaerolineaceae bacterium]|nr:CoA pyrophosphatase [Anaerolineaceae bacterium]